MPSKKKVTKIKDEDIALEDLDAVPMADDDDEVVTLEAIKKRFVDIGRKSGGINAADVLDATAHLDLTEDDFQALINYFHEQGIAVEADDEPEDLEAIDGPGEGEDIEAEMQEDVIDEDDESVSEEDKEDIAAADMASINMGDVKVNDSVKMYLKEIGKTRLLKENEEKELAKRIVAGRAPNATDWEKMEDSDKTLETLESEMERSFPPDIPYVRKKSGYLTDSVYLPIRCFILNNAFLQGADINKSVWAHPAAKDITRFERYNTFGVPTEDDDGLPEDPDQKETCLKFLNTIDERFEVAHSSDLITLAAWTYHPLQVPHVTEYVRKYIRDLGQRCSTKYFKLDAGKASFCANMFTSQDDGVLFMKAFFRKLSTGSFEQGVSGANHWYRAAYQIMMSNPDVFEILAQDLSQIYTTLNMLISSYYSSQSGSGIRSNICKILCFMMKLRSVYSEFCKQDENDVISVDGSYYILLNMLSSNGTEPVRLFIDRYISLLNISDYKDSEVLLIYKAIGLKLSQRQAFEKCFYQYLSESVLMNVGLLHDESVLRNIARRNDSCFGDVKRWGSILNLYLNGKGNLNIPTADL